MNVKITCQEILECLMKAAINSAYFGVVFSGIEFSSSYILRKFTNNKHFNVSELKYMFIDPLLDDHKSSLKISDKGMLWLHTDSTIAVSRYVTLLLKHMSLSAAPVGLVTTALSSKLLSALTALNRAVNSLTVLPLRQPALKDVMDSSDKFGEFIHVNRGILEYLQLRWYRLCMLPLDSLQKCTKLRVLSITLNTTTAFSSIKYNTTTVKVLEALQHLQCLEYFEWSEPLNVYTRDILALYSLLSNYLPELLHWHWKLNSLLLSTTDLNNPHFKPLQDILTILLDGKTASSWCTNYKFSLDNPYFKGWLRGVRPLTCFCHCPSLSNVSHLQFIRT